MQRHPAEFDPRVTGPLSPEVVRDKDARKPEWITSERKTGLGIFTPIRNEDAVQFQTVSSGRLE